MKIKIALLFLLILGFIWRIYGLNNNYGLWSDEVHVGIFARRILQTGKPVLKNGYNTGAYQFLQYYLSAILGLRMPSLIFGVLSILAVYLLMGELLGSGAKTLPHEESKPTSGGLLDLVRQPPRFLVASLLPAFLIAFLKIEILWSRQARPYQALQFCFLISSYLLIKLTKKYNLKLFILLLLTNIFAILMHGLGLVLLFNNLLFLILANFKKLKFKLLLFLPIVLIFGLSFKHLILGAFSKLGQINNLYYYRVFLTHNYLPILIFSILGFGILIKEKKFKIALLFSIFLGSQFFVTGFLLGQPFVRYIYIIFGFLVILFVYFLFNMPKFLLVLLLGVSLFFMKDKFAFLPQKTYSLNNDMQEIPEVDWDKIYGFADKYLKDNKKTLLITNWNDLPIWYLGEGSLDYLIRKDNRKTDPVSNAEYINNLDKFKEIISKNKVLIIMDSWDNYVPLEIREYIENNFRNIYTIDRLYEIQPRYWPVGVYEN